MITREFNSRLNQCAKSMLANPFNIYIEYSNKYDAVNTLVEVMNSFAVNSCISGFQLGKLNAINVLTSVKTSTYGNKTINWRYQSGDIQLIHELSHFADLDAEKRPYRRLTEQNNLLKDLCAEAIALSFYGKDYRNYRKESFGCQTRKETILYIEKMAEHFDGKEGSYSYLSYFGKKYCIGDKYLKLLKNIGKEYHLSFEKIEDIIERLDNQFNEIYKNCKLRD